MTKIRVLMISRTTLFSDPGGDTIQVKSTAKYLRELGVDVDIKLANETGIDYQSYDLLHLFNVIRPNDLLLHAAASGRPFVLSSIYVDYTEYERNSRNGIKGFLARMFNSFQIEYFKVIARALINGEKIVSARYLTMGHRKSMQWLLRNASCILPNSQNEMNRLEKDLKVSNRYRVVPNAIDRDRFRPVTVAGDRKGVLCVARIEGRKNQLSLIRAMQGLDIDLTIIGKASPNHQDYLRQCRESAAPNVQFLQQLPQEELRDHYSRAKVHVLPSWFETTGLSSLEAAYMGCNIVVTKKGDTEEYFNGFATYCEPADLNSIRSAVLHAYEQEYPEALRARIDNQFTWEETARITLEAYQDVLSKKRKN